MATKQILAAHAISALKEHTRKFDAMSVHLAKSADLAINQAIEIAQWTSRLINVMTKIQQETQRDAAARRICVRGKVRSLEAQAVSTKRKILDTAELESSRTIKANFRVIFGPPRETEYRSKSTKSVMATNLVRITTIRGLCESNPYAVIALSATYPTKVWTEASLEVFDGLIELLKDEQEQDWPEEIVDIMDELEAERPMSAEFGILRAKISQRQGIRRRRFGEFGRPGLEATPLPPMQTGELAQTTGQHAARMTQLPSLQQMALVVPSFNHDQTQGRPCHTQTEHHDSAEMTAMGERAMQFGKPAGPPATKHGICHVADGPALYNEQREIKYMYTNALASDISKLPEPLRTAVQNSRLWKWERSQELETTGCLSNLFPKSNAHDVTFTIFCGHQDGYRLNDFFGIQLATSP